MPKAIEFRGHLGNARNRLGTFRATYSDYSDIQQGVDPGKLERLALAIENLLQASSQLPPTVSPSEYESTIVPYINPLKREIETARQWAGTTKAIADASIAELSSKSNSK